MIISTVGEVTLTDEQTDKHKRGWFYNLSHAIAMGQITNTVNGDVMR